MPIGTATLTFDISDLIGVDFDTRRTKVWITTNIPGDSIIDTEGNKIRLGTGNVTLNADGTGSAVVWVPGAGTNPSSWQTYVHVDYPDRHATGGRDVRTFGPFTITASADLADLVQQQEIPPDFSGAAFIADVEAIRDSQVDISGISTSDGVVEALVKNTGGVGPLTSAALSATYDPRSRHDVRLSGVVGDGVTNDSAAAATAAAYCVANNLAFWLPAGLTMRLATATTLDLRHMDVLLEGVVSIDQNTAVGIQWGGTSVNTVFRAIRFARIINTTTDPANPSLRIVGVKHTKSTFGACDFIQFYADASDATISSCAYSLYDLSGAIINRLEFHGVNGTAWHNDNKFFGGRLKTVRFSGSYPHNGNKFYGPTMEAGVLDMQVGVANMFHDVRLEDSLTATFAAGASHNVVVDAYASNPAAISPMATVTDLGRENFVTSSRTSKLRPVELVRMDRFSKVFDSASEYACATPPVPGLRSLAVRTANALVFDSGILPVEHFPETVSSTGEVLARTTRFTFTSSHRVWRPAVYCYDANGVLLNSASGTYIDTIGGWIASAGGYIKSASNSGTARICIIDPAVKHVRITIQSASATGTVFDWVSLVAYVPEPHLDSIVNVWRRAIDRPLYQTASPTQGVAHKGESVGHATGRYTCVERKDTTLASAAAAAATTVTVASATGMSSGDVIGVALDTGATHWTTISGAPAGAVVTLAVALPGAAALGLPVATNRWVSIV